MKKNSVRYFSIESIVANEFISDQKKKKMKNQLVKKNSKKKKKKDIFNRKFKFQLPRQSNQIHISKLNISQLVRNHCQ